MQITATVISSPAGHEVTVQTAAAVQQLAVPAKPDGRGSGVNGGEFLMLSLATCYCNDLYREAKRLGIPVDGAQVEASAHFPGIGLAAMDVSYRATVRSSAPASDVQRLLRETDAVAEVHNTLRAGVAVRLMSAQAEAVDSGKVHRTSADAPVTLREITAETVRAIVSLEVADAQKGFVASNAISLAQALFSPEAWYRAIYIGDEPAGFVMVYDEALRPEPPAAPRIGVWRLMIDSRFQGRGIGTAAMRQVIDHVRAKGLYPALEVSYVPGDGCPEPFYRRLGFRPTGRMDGAEVVLELPLEPARA